MRGENYEGQEATERPGEQENLAQGKQGLDLSKFYHYLQGIKNLPAKEVKENAGFGNRKLRDIGRSLLETLNNLQACYDKHYVGSICVFICLINIRFHSGLASKLKQPFFASLAPILDDICHFWTQNQTGDKFQAARAKLVAFFRILTELPSKRPTFLFRIYNKKLLDVLCNFQLPNDKGIISIFSRIVSLAVKVQSPAHTKKLAFNLYQSLRHPNFPIPMLDPTLELIMSELDDTFFGWNGEVVVIQKLKDLIKQNLKGGKEQINLSLAFAFLNRIVTRRGQSAFELSQLCQFCEVVKNSMVTKGKVQFLKSMAMEVVPSEQQLREQHVLQLLPFSLSYLGLQIISPILAKLSSVGLLMVVMGGFIENIAKMMRDPKEKKCSRYQMYKVLVGLTIKMFAVNEGVYHQMRNNLQYLCDSLPEYRKQIDLLHKTGFSTEDNNCQFSFL